MQIVRSDMASSDRAVSDKEVEAIGRIGGVMASAIAVLKYDLIIDYFIRIAGSGSGITNIVLLAVLLLWPLGSGREHDSSTRWWVERPLWIAVPAVILVGLVAVFGRFERPRRPGGAAGS